MAPWWETCELAAWVAPQAGFPRLGCPHAHDSGKAITQNLWRDAYADGGGLRGGWKAPFVLFNSGVIAALRLWTLRGEDIATKPLGLPGDRCRMGSLPQAESLHSLHGFVLMRDMGRALADC
jgi:hypothetical protein